MAEVGIREAKTHLSRLLRRVEAGEEIAIRRGNTVVARLVPAVPAGKRILGMDAGRYQVPEDFDAPLDEETLASFAH
ncbi:MAG: type II toxin-antitoxin system prevent-host-death family antitoxin [Trueperaceae bacterium]|nr:type II toxin-antitoxin system prevent-host-death family antitoxin [Trueperaceae bacterium]